MKNKHPQTINYMLNMQINDWKILEIRPNKRKGFVLAECVCGNKKEVTGRSIRNGNSKNCGCRKGEKMRGKQKIPGTDSALRACYSQYRASARQKYLDFNLDINQFKEITSKNCYYCGVEPKNRAERHKYIYYYNGIDRVDNDKGYILDNIVPCCSRCNTHKGGITMNIIKKILEFFNDKT